jgi:hypothetical protein
MKYALVEAPSGWGSTPMVHPERYDTWDDANDEADRRLAAQRPSQIGTRWIVVRIAA